MMVIPRFDDRIQSVTAIPDVENLPLMIALLCAMTIHVSPFSPQGPSFIPNSEAAPKAAVISDPRTTTYGTLLMTTLVIHMNTVIKTGYIDVSTVMDGNTIWTITTTDNLLGVT